jgi:hypothetical protein
MSFEGPIEDRLAIHELVASYGDAISRHSVEELMPLWSADASWEHPQIGRFVGRAVIIDALAEAMTRYPLLVLTGSLGALNVHGERASGRNYTAELVTDENGVTYHMTGRYDDEYVKRDGRWLFQARRFNILHSG